MKAKRFFYAALMVVCTLSMTALTSCGDKDHNNPSDPTEEPEEPKAVAAMMSMSVYFTPKTLECFDISFDYLDENGENKNTKVNDSNWSLTVQTPGLPAKLGYHMNVAVKADLDRTKYDEFEIDYYIATYNGLIDQNGQKYGSNYGGEGSSGRRSSMENIDSFVNDFYANHPLQSLHYYAADGAHTKMTWE